MDVLQRVALPVMSGEPWAFIAALLGDKRTRESKLCV
jgi:hypothetical protein